MTSSTVEMPYNTRRKSLSLSSLGIHVPVTHAERAAAAAAAAAAAVSTTTSPQHTSTPGKPISSHPASSVPPGASPTCHPNKKQKRSHNRDSRSLVTTPVPTSRLRRGESAVAVNFDNTPPPSPKSRDATIDGDGGDEIVPRKIDLEGIKDEIVGAVIVRLEDTANRPHLIKELADVLSQQLASVRQSANPCAIVSSRLSSYLKRTCWSALAPCPLAKELEPLHPRRTFYYLTTRPRQPLPELYQSIPRSVISPSISGSDASSLDEDNEDRIARRELSPSPEVDLSPPHFDDVDDDIVMPTTPVGSLPTTIHGPQGQRNTSPPLEKDEKEFTQTADGLQKRKLTGEILAAGNNSEQAHTDDHTRDDIFDDRQIGIVGTTASFSFMTSPAVRACFPPSSAKKDPEDNNWLKLGKFFEWDHSPEDIELDELDFLLDAC